MSNAFGKSEVEEKLTEENLAVALTFLNCDVGSTTADEVEAVWRLLDLEGGSRGELEEYLVSRGKFEMEDKLTEENLAVALTFLNCDVGSTTADEVEAVWRLLDLEGGSRGELEEYLLSR